MRLRRVRVDKTYPGWLTGCALAWTALVLVLCAPVWAQAPPPDRPRVGLALGGGGARGFAHIGVLRALEEMRVPVDRIAGTSIGAVIGGLYAAGYDARTLERIVVSIDWVDLFNDDPPRDALSYRRKQEDREFFLNLEIGLREGTVDLPRGLVQGQKLNLLLRRLLAPVALRRDFEQLGVPYSAVAADLETGEAVVLREGDLAPALRASMSVPGVFAPVEVGNRVLVDGGTANNLPVDVIRPDVEVVIAVDVSAPVRRARDLRTVLDVSDQVINTVIEKNQQRQIELLDGGDVLLRPDLGGAGSSDFARAADSIAAGYAAAQAFSEQLQTLSLSPEDYAEHEQRRRAVRENQIHIDRVGVRNESRLQTPIIRRELRARPQQTLDVGQLHEDLERLYGLDYFERVDYSVREESGTTDLVVSAREKAWGPDYLRFGLALQDDFQGGNSFDLAVGHTRTPLNRWGAEWRNVARIGERPLLRSELYQPLGAGGPYFAAGNAEFGAVTEQVFAPTESLPRAEFRTRFSGAGMDVGRLFSNWGEVRVGLRARRTRTAPRIGDPELPVTVTDDIGYSLVAGYDTLDSLHFPRQGTFAELSVFAPRRSLGADEDFNIVDLTAANARSWGRHGAIVRVVASALLDSEAPLRNLRSLGGFLNISGLAPGQITGQNLVVGNLIYLHRLTRAALVQVDNPVYLGASLEAGNTWRGDESIRADDLVSAASVFLGADTVVGPVYLGYGLADTGDSSFYLLVGQLF